MKKTYTQKMKVSTGLCLLVGVLTANRAGASNNYFQNPTTGGSWDASVWGPSGGPYTGAWTSGAFARFLATGTYTVTVANSELMTGMYDDTAAASITFNAIGSGNIEVETAVQGFLAGSSSGSTASIIINAPVTGNGGIAPEEGGNLYLNGINTYSGGTALGDSGNTLVYFNNSSSFGSGGITLNRTGNFSTLLGTGGAPITFNNNISTVVGNTGANTELNFAANANTPVTVGGTVSLGTVNLNVRSSGGSSSPLTISGPIGGSGNLILSANGSSSTTLSGANTYTGTTTLTGVGTVISSITMGGSGTPTLILGANNVLSTSTGLGMYGGNLNMNGFNTSVNGALTLNGSSTINFLSGSEQLTLGNSSPVTWTAGQTLALTGYAINNLGQTTGDMYVGVGGLTTAQLAEITIDGESGAYITQAGDALGAGYVEVPEPSTLALGAMGGLGMLWMIKRRKTA